MDEACKKRCLDRMVCWFRLAIDVCQAERPYHDIVNALQVFAVAGSASSADSQVENLQSQNLERLATCFGCSAIDLEAPYIENGMKTCFWTLLGIVRVC